MKKFLWALFAFAIYGCTDQIKSSVPDISDPISFSATSFSLDADGRAQTFTVDAAEGVWNVSPSADWLHVTPKNGTGSVKVSVSADVNHTDIERSAAMEFTMPGYFNGIISLPVTQAAGYGEEPGPGDEEVSFNHPYLNCYEMPAIPNIKTDLSSCSKDKDDSGPWWNSGTSVDKQVIITHACGSGVSRKRNWTALFDGNKRAPIWSAFIMHKDVFPDNNVKRGSWHDDPAVPSDWQNDDIWEGSGEKYHRGHLVASNYRQAIKAQDNYQTFYRTNQALQEQDHFNGAIWQQLENQVAAKAPTGKDTLYVVVGLLFEGDPRPNLSEADAKAYEAPSHYYKLLMKCSFNTDGSMKSAKGVAYLMENIAYDNNDYDSHTTTIDAIEQRTGFDFFTNVPKELQDAAERTSSPIW